MVVPQISGFFDVIVLNTVDKVKSLQKYQCELVHMFVTLFAMKDTDCITNS